MGQNRIEKITERFAVDLEPGHRVRAGDIVKVRPRHVLTHDNTGAVMPKFEQLGASRIFDPSQPMLALDHDVQNRSEKNLAKYRSIEAFARQHGLAFFPAGHGIGHQLMIEEGFVLPGTFVVASDSHANSYGALGALGTPVVRTDAASIWATGETWWQVPEVIRVRLEGELRGGVTGKDVIIALCGHFNRDEVLNAALEFEGPGVAGLSIDDRIAVANMTTEWGALAGVFPYDGVAEAYLRARAAAMRERRDPNPRLTDELIDRFGRDNPLPDGDAFYSKEIFFDLSSVTPHVSGPDDVKHFASLAEIEPRQVKVDRAYLLSCVNGRLSDLAAAAALARGKKFAPGVKVYLAAASAHIEQQARQSGDWQALLEAGAIALPPGCGACIGLGEGLLEAGEVGISATNRNFKGRMGSAEAKVYLGSPAVVAASALRGYIAAPAPVETRPLVGSIRSNPRPVEKRPPAALRSGFPPGAEGRLLLMPRDNLNTDGIYGKEFTYQDNLPPAEMAAAAFKNYDPHFQSLARAGDIVVGGQNFGCGSSREQAATALKHRGVALVIAASFSQTYSRNAFNNGFIVIECPALVEALRAQFEQRTEPTVDTGLVAKVDFAAGAIEVAGQRYAFPPLGSAAQELVTAGGLEEMLRRRVAALAKA
ncbi:MAG: homoaconitase [Deltaproteobacteria bacterium]|nr:homoaconitase [Deltaproteobacteria bacterium]